MNSGVGLLLYSNCILVKGAGRAAIYDLQRKDIYPVPHSMAALFTADRYFNTSLLSQYTPEEQLILKDYIHFLKTYELAFNCNEEEVKHFPELAREWIFPGHITHCILDTNTGAYDYLNSHFLQQLNRLCCSAIQFRFYQPVALSYLEQLLLLISNSDIRSTEFLLPFSPAPGFEEQMIRLITENPKINTVIIHSAQEDEVVIEGRNGMGYLLRTKKIIDGPIHCGIISTALFAVGIPVFTEALHYNSCLNRKISIDVDGEIKNCPSMPESFGNIKDISLQDALDKPGFKRYWNITKDQVTKCRDCEFRYACTDCRAYLDDPEDLYSAPLKCGYDPYTCTWAEWSNHPMKQKGIGYYGLQKDHSPGR